MDMDYSASRASRVASHEAMKRLNRYREIEEYNDAINKLPIDERAAIKDVLQKIRDANLDDKLAELARKHARERAEWVALQKEMEEFGKEKTRIEKVKFIGICVLGTLAYSCATLITR